MMENLVRPEKNRLPLAYLFSGFVLGSLFAIVAYAIEIAFLSSIPLEKSLWDFYRFLHTINPVLYLTDLAPFVLMVVGAILGKKHAESVRSREKLLKLLREHSSRLKNVSQRYEKLFNNVDDCFFETDMSGRVQDMNPAGIKTLQIQEFLGMEGEDKEVILEEMRRKKVTVADIYEDPADQKRFVAILSKEGRVSNFQFQLRRLDGDVFDASMDAFLDYDEKGHPIVLSRLIDLSSVKQAQYLLQATNNLLEERNSELIKTVGELQALKGRYQQRSDELDTLNSELKRTNEKLKEMAITDGLTGLYNYRYLMELFEREWERAKRTRKEFCLLMIDIDHFKSFNDTWGHQTGDRVLRLVAEMIKTQIRQYDVAARYGGEEFAVILPETDTTTCYAVASRIRKTVEEMDLMLEKNGKRGKVTISIGLTGYLSDKEDSRSSDQLLQDADSGLYLAKSKGRNRIEVYHRNFLTDSVKPAPFSEKTR